MRLIASSLLALLPLASAAADIATLEEHLGRYLAGARASAPAADACIRANHQAWVRSVREKCKDADCRRAAYLDRLAELDGLQPGATAVKNLELPRRPTLVLVIPPAADKVAAPSNPRAVARQATGAIVDDAASAEGFVLRTDTGERLVLVQLMFLESASAARLEALARDRDAAFTASGHVIAASGDGARAFEPSRCIFIHRSGFRPHQLPFALPTDGIARAEHRSPPFHAVILRTAEPCSIREQDRLEAQRLFPVNKVFATRFGCEDGDPDPVTYTNVDAKWGFLAVHAGHSPEDADRMLARVRATGRYPGANVRRMQAVLVYP